MVRGLCCWCYPTCTVIVRYYQVIFYKKILIDLWLFTEDVHLRYLQLCKRLIIQGRPTERS